MLFFIVDRDQDLVELRDYLMFCDITYSVALTRRTSGAVWLVMVQAGANWQDILLLKWPRMRVDYSCD